MGKFLDSLSYLGGLAVGGSVFVLGVAMVVGVGYDQYKSRKKG
jgi:hypothetical protein